MIPTVHRSAIVFSRLAASLMVAGIAIGISFAESPSWLSTGRFRWKCSPPLIDIDPKAAEPEVALKDPTFVQFDGRWHLFATHRLASGMVNMQYLSFTDWSDANKATRHTLELHDQYHCAPQVFWFTPQKKWYLVYQLADKNRALKFAPYFSTTSDISDPKSWTKPQPMIETLPEGGDKTKWIDFWVICSGDKAHLFYTSDDGHFWRRETAKSSFPLGWSKPELVLQDTKDELFEASCTYKLRSREQYLTIIEAIGSGCRYYKAWIANKLEGPWRRLATFKDKPFAATGVNVDQAQPWTRSISHGELVRSGIDEKMEIDPTNLRFVFQGVDDEGYKGNRYGSIPWRIGMLELKPLPVSIEDALQSVVIPQISFADATLEEALEFFRARQICVDSPTDGPGRVNMIVLPQGGELEAKRSIELKDVTLGEALQKVATSYGQTMAVQTHAVVFGSNGKTLKQWKWNDDLKATKIVFPSITFDGATLAEAVEFLRVKSRLLDPAKEGVEIKIESGEKDKPAITLSVDDIPLPDALFYCAQLAGFNVSKKGKDFILTPAKKP